MVKIAIVGTGYVGLVSGVCLAENGHNVICCDVNENKIDMLNRLEMPIFEVGLEDLVRKNIAAKRLSFTCDIGNAIRESEVVFSCVGTPMGEGHKADLKYVREVAKVFAQNLNDYKIFVNKSTVPVGTGAMVEEIISQFSSQSFDVVSNPEFLKEGAAIKDFLNPDRIVVGASSQRAKELMLKVYKPFIRMQHPIVFTDVKSAELIKYASNSMLALRISFMNEIANFCDRVGADVKEVAKGMGYDNRIGPRFLQAGIGYGGSCFPKDVVALIESGKEVGCEFSILDSVEEVNRFQKTVIVDKLVEKFGDLSGKCFGIWGLSFKPRTNDVREAPSIYIIKKLLSLGARIKVHDPIAMQDFKDFNSELNVEYCQGMYDVTCNVDALLVLTEWDEFRCLDYNRIDLKDNLIVDGRNIYNPYEVIDAGFEYIGIGRNIVVKKEGDNKLELLN